MGAGVPEELPPRPRRRLLGAGGNPISLALLGVLLLACGFIGGVLVEKGQTSSSAAGSGAAAGLAARFAALRGAGGAGSTSAGNGTGSTERAAAARAAAECTTAKRERLPAAGLRGTFGRQLRRSGQRHDRRSLLHQRATRCT